MVDEPIIEQAPISVRLAQKDTYRILIMDSVENANLLKEACKLAFICLANLSTCIKLLNDTRIAG